VTALLVNIDVDDLERATRFYCAALGLQVGRRFDGWTELVGTSAPLYLLPKAPETPVSPKSDQKRDYRRHWTPVHLDFVVDDIEQSLARAKAAGASVESAVTEHAYGRLVLLADPFGNGFCLLQFTGRGYDEIAR
jgi:predicted enzyme related to lactoylglutathione lyase